MQKSWRSPEKAHKQHGNRWSRLYVTSVGQIKATRRHYNEPTQMAITQNVDITKTQQGCGGPRNSHALLIETRTATFESWLAVCRGAYRHRDLPKWSKTNVYRSLPTNVYSSFMCHFQDLKEIRVPFFFFFFFHLCVSVGGGQKGVRSPGAGVRGSCELLDVGAGNRVLRKNSMWS